MTIDQIDLADMAAMARRGTLGGDIDPVAELSAAEIIVRDRDTSVRWKVLQASRVTLRIESPNGAATEDIVPLVGRRVLRFSPIGRYRIVLRASPLPARFPRRRRRGPIQMEAIVTVVAPKPTAEIHAPAATRYGEPVSIAWTSTEADQIQLLIDGVSRPVDANGNITIQFGHCGAHEVALVARGEGGGAHSNREVQVVAPPVTISAPAVRETEFGRPALIDYRITGARIASVYVVGTREPPSQIQMAGRLEVEVWLAPERLRIVAEGFDGRRVVHTITVTAKAFVLPSIADELAALNNARPGLPCISDELAFLNDWRP